MSESGIGLDRYFDFQVTDTGDIDAATGKSEVEKDLSVLVADVISDVTLGTIVTSNDKEVLRSRIRTRVLSYERVDEVPNVTVSFAPSSDVVEVQLTAVAESDVLTVSVAR